MFVFTSVKRGLVKQSELTPIRSSPASTSSSTRCVTIAFYRRKRQCAIFATDDIAIYLNDVVAEEKIEQRAARRRVSSSDLSIADSESSESAASYVVIPLLMEDDDFIVPDDEVDEDISVVYASLDASEEESLTVLRESAFRLYLELSLWP